MNEEEVIEEHVQAKQLVWEVLNDDERARNDDLWLILQIWQKKQQIKLFIPYDKLKEMVKPETITRCRRLFQEVHKDGTATHPHLLPTDPKVWHQRKFKEETLRKYFGDRQSYLMEYQAIAYGVK